MKALDTHPDAPRFLGRTATSGRQTTMRARPFSGSRLIRMSSTERADLWAYLQIPKVVRWSFIGFASAIPFEGASIATSLSLSKLSGVVFIACYLFFYNPLSGKRRFPSGSVPLFWFLAYFAIFLANGIFLDAEDLGQFARMALTLTQLLLVFWIAGSLLTVELLRRRVLLGFAFGAVASAVATLLKIPGFAIIIEGHLGERLTSMDSNPNYVAFTMAIAAVILLGTVLDTKTRSLWRNLFLISLTLPLLAVAVRTGSRTGVASFFIGFAICLFFNSKPGYRLAAVLLFAMVTSSIGFLVVRYPTLMTRFEEASEGNLAGRQNIIPAALDMISERPVLGWQPILYWEELGRRTGRVFGSRDAHNLVLHLFLEVGFVGAAPFLIGIGVCVQGAWRARSHRVGILPFALLITALSSNLTLNYIARKPQWLIFALAVAAASVSMRKKAPHPYLIRRPLLKDYVHRERAWIMPNR